MDVIQSVTSNRKDIPAHYIAISSFGCHKGNTDQKASAEYKVLYRAWCDEQIGGIKFMANPHDKRGQIYVDPAEAQRLIDGAARQRLPKKSIECDAKSGSASQIEAAAASLASIDTTLDEIYRVLERLTTAVEGIATQPKTPQQELLHTFSGNGFHS